jgi:hypothetical protein
MMTPRPEAVSCGCPESPRAGTSSGSTTKGSGSNSAEVAGDGSLERQAAPPSAVTSRSIERARFITKYSSRSSCPKRYFFVPFVRSEESVRKSSGASLGPIDYNRPVIRRLTAAALVVLVQAGTISAPLMHVHLDAADTSHHHGQALHAHLSGHDAVIPSHPGPRADHQDDEGRVVAANIFVAAAMESFSLPAMTSPAFVLVVPPAQLSGRTPRVAHAVDPPPNAVRSPRAPPLFLS